MTDTHSVEPDINDDDLESLFDAFSLESQIEPLPAVEATDPAPLPASQIPFELPEPIVGLVNQLAATPDDDLLDLFDAFADEALETAASSNTHGVTNDLKLTEPAIRADQAAGQILTKPEVIPPPTEVLEEQSSASGIDAQADSNQIVSAAPQDSPSKVFVAAKRIKPVVRDRYAQIGRKIEDLAFFRNNPLLMLNLHSNGIDWTGGVEQFLNDNKTLADGDRVLGVTSLFTDSSITQRPQAIRRLAVKIFANLAVLSELTIAEAYPGWLEEMPPATRRTWTQNLEEEVARRYASIPEPSVPESDAESEPPDTSRPDEAAQAQQPAEPVINAPAAENVVTAKPAEEIISDAPTPPETNAGSDSEAEPLIDIETQDKIAAEIASGAPAAAIESEGEPLTDEAALDRIVEEIASAAPVAAIESEAEPLTDEQTQDQIVEEIISSEPPTKNIAVAVAEQAAESASEGIDKISAQVRALSLGIPGTTAIRDSYSKDGRPLHGIDFFSNAYLARNILRRIGVTTTQGLYEFLIDNNVCFAHPDNIEQTIDYLESNTPFVYLDPETVAGMALGLGYHPTYIYPTDLAKIDDDNRAWWYREFNTFADGFEQKYGITPRERPTHARADRNTRISTPRAPNTNAEANIQPSRPRVKAGQLQTSIFFPEYAAPLQDLLASNRLTEPHFLTDYISNNNFSNIAEPTIAKTVFDLSYMTSERGLLHLDPDVLASLSLNLGVHPRLSYKQALVALSSLSPHRRAVWNDRFHQLAIAYVRSTGKELQGSRPMPTSQAFTDAVYIISDTSYNLPFSEGRAARLSSTLRQISELAKTAAPEERVQAIFDIHGVSRNPFLQEHGVGTQLLQTLEHLVPELLDTRWFRDRRWRSFIDGVFYVSSAQGIGAGSAELQSQAQALLVNLNERTSQAELRAREAPANDRKSEAQVADVPATNVPAVAAETSAESALTRTDQDETEGNPIAAATIATEPLSMEMSPSETAEEPAVATDEADAPDLTVAKVQPTPPVAAVETHQEVKAAEAVEGQEPGDATTYASDVAPDQAQPIAAVTTVEPHHEEADSTEVVKEQEPADSTADAPDATAAQVQPTTQVVTAEEHHAEVTSTESADGQEPAESTADVPEATAEQAQPTAPTTGVEEYHEQAASTDADDEQEPADSETDLPAAPAVPVQPTTPIAVEEAPQDEPDSTQITEAEEPDDDETDVPDAFAAPVQPATPTVNVGADRGQPVDRAPPPVVRPGDGKPLDRAALIAAAMRRYLPNVREDTPASDASSASSAEQSAQPQAATEPASSPANLLPVVTPITISDSNIYQSLDQCQLFADNQNERLRTEIWSRLRVKTIRDLEQRLVREGMGSKSLRHDLGRYLGGEVLIYEQGHHHLTRLAERVRRLAELSEQDAYPLHYFTMHPENAPAGYFRQQARAIAQRSDNTQAAVEPALEQNGDAARAEASTTTGAIPPVTQGGSLVKTESGGTSSQTGTDSTFSEASTRATRISVAVEPAANTGQDILDQPFSHFAVASLLQPLVSDLPRHLQSLRDIQRQLVSRGQGAFFPFIRQLFEHGINSGSGGIRISKSDARGRPEILPFAITLLKIMKPALIPMVAFHDALVAEGTVSNQISGVAHSVLGSTIYTGRDVAGSEVANSGNSLSTAARSALGRSAAKQQPPALAFRTLVRNHSNYAYDANRGLGALTSVHEFVEALGVSNNARWVWGRVVSRNDALSWGELFEGREISSDRYGLHPSYSGRAASPLDEKNDLIEEAAALIIILRIPTVMVEEAVPVLRGKIVLTDALRSTSQSDPAVNLQRFIANAMIQMHAITIIQVNGLLKKSGHRPIPSDHEAELVSVLNNPDPNALRNNAWALDRMNEAFKIPQNLLSPATDASEENDSSRVRRMDTETGSVKTSAHSSVFENGKPTLVL